MKKFVVIFLLFTTVSCEQKKVLTEQEIKAYEAELAGWYEKRVDELKAPNGWINLIGLYWLEPGINSFGSGEQNKIVFPKGTLPEKAGYFLLSDNVVTIFPDKNVSIVSNGSAIGNKIIFNPDSARSAPLLEFGSLRWNIIKRDDKFGIRVRDLASEEVSHFTGIERYPVDPALRLEARFETSDSTKTIDITNMIGQTTAQRSPGTFVFEIEGKEYRLDALMGSKEERFIIFADATSGKETYGGGRFLYVNPTPDANGKILLDFNKAYNPPCVFTPFATCPLPPRQNVLPLEIRAGEKNYGHGS